MSVSVCIDQSKAVHTALAITPPVRYLPLLQVMKTAVPGKGKILTQISLFWFELFKDICPNHIITCDVDEMPEKVRKCDVYSLFVHI